MGLTLTEKQFYEKNGYIHLSNVFTPEEVEEIGDALDSIYKNKDLDLDSDPERNKKVTFD